MRAVRATLHRGEGQVQHVRRLLSREPFDVAKQKHLALLGAETLERVTLDERREGVGVAGAGLPEQHIVGQAFLVGRGHVERWKRL